MSHEEAFSELAAVALDAVSVDVASAVRAHAAACPECGPELAAMEQTVATLGTLVPDVQMNRGRGAGIRSRLVTRARSERESKTATAPGVADLSRGVASLTGQGHRITPMGTRVVTGETKRVTPARTPRVTDVTPLRSGINWYAIAATVALILTGAQLMRVSRQRNEMRAELASATAVSAVNPVDSMANMVRQKDSMITAMSGPDVKVVALTTQGQKQPLGKMMWNRKSDDWIMVTYNLRQPKKGMTYQVWLVTDKAKISAGTFHPDATGGTVMHARYAMEPNALRAVAITEEPEGGMPSPTGPMVVAGSA